MCTGSVVQASIIPPPPPIVNPPDTSHVTLVEPSQTLDTHRVYTLYYKSSQGRSPTVNTFTQLTKTIDQLHSEGKTVKLTRLPSQATRSHKTLWTVKNRGKGSVKVS